MTVVGGAAWWVTPGRWGESVWPQLQGSRTRYWFFSPFFEVWWKVQSFEAQLKCSHRSLFKYLYPIILSTKMSGRVKYQVNKWSIAGVLVCMYYTSTKVSLNRLPKWLPVTCPLRTQFTAAVRTCGTHHYSLGQHRPVPAWLFLLICLFIYCLSIFFFNGEDMWSSGADSRYTYIDIDALLLTIHERISPSPRQGFTHSTTITSRTMSNGFTDSSKYVIVTQDHILTITKDAPPSKKNHTARTSTRRCSSFHSPPHDWIFLSEMKQQDVLPLACSGRIKKGC